MKHCRKKTEELKNRYESEEVIEIIDEDSNSEKPVKRDRKKEKGRKKRLDSLSDNDETDEEKVAAQKRGKKRKKQVCVVLPFILITRFGQCK